MSTWSKADIKLLKSRFPSHPTAEVAFDLKRPTEAVKKQAQRLGLKKSARYLRSLGRVAAVVLCLFATTQVNAADFSAGVTADYETTLTTLSYRIDPNAWIGAAMTTDSEVEGNHIFAGPIARINTGGIYRTAASAIIPDKYLAPIWQVGEDIPVQSFAQGSIQWDLTDKGLMFIVGTGFIIFPENRLQPTIFTGWFKNKGEPFDMRTTFGVTIAF